MRTAAVVEAHAANASFDDAFDGSAPAGVKGGDDALAAIGHQNRDAIGGLHGEQQTGLGGDVAVGAARSGAGCIGRRGLEDKVGVDLLEGEDWGSVAAGNGLGQQAAVGEDDCAFVGRGETEIQLAGRVFGAIGAAQAAFPGAESAPKPGKIPAGNGQPFDAVGGAAGNGKGRGELLGSDADKAGGTGRAGTAGLRAARVADQACLHEEGVEQFGIRRSGRRKGGGFRTGRRPHRSFDSIENREQGNEGTRELRDEGTEGLRNQGTEGLRD